MHGIRFVLSLNHIESLLLFGEFDPFTFSVFTLILTVIMQYLTRAMVYFSLVLGTVIVFALACWFWYNYHQLSYLL